MLRPATSHFARRAASVPHHSNHTRLTIRSRFLRRALVLCALASIDDEHLSSTASKGFSLQGTRALAETLRATATKGKPVYVCCTWYLIKILKACEPPCASLLSARAARHHTMHNKLPGTWFDLAATAQCPPHPLDAKLVHYFHS